MNPDPRDRGGPAQPLLIVENLRKHFPVRGGMLNRKVATVQAVDDVSFVVRKGETLGIVGESGCGKSTTARLLHAPDRAGRRQHRVRRRSGRRAAAASRVNAMRRQMQMVFQDSYSSLNPRMTMVDSVAYAPRMHGVPAQGSHPARGAPAGPGRPEPAHLCAPLSARTVRRPAPARQHRPRAGAGTAAGDPGRGGVRARQIDRGAGAEPAARPEAAVQPDLPVHQPRPERRANMSPTACW